MLQPGGECWIAGLHTLCRLLKKLTHHLSRVQKTSEGWVGENAHVVGADAATHQSWFPLKDVDGHPVLRIMAPR
ncbi:hypothetical protein [Paraburkholderia sp. J67]|uniref:hypothetical protein n=1 Tax=Paraburkholderia sp. J67 TaxID=2805435 RepID=UPI002ABD4168|nr:hypothetical protein [Paraburkholderia sp. J67]